MNLPDVDVLDLVQRGYRFALSLTHDSGRADDLVQDAWFALLQKNGAWNRGYLFATIRNRFIDQCRRHERLPMESLDISAPTEAMDGSLTSWQEDYGAPPNGAFEAALSQLRPQERAVLYLAAVEDYSAQDIADLLECPRGTVLSLIHRARAKIRAHVEALHGVRT